MRKLPKDASMNPCLQFEIICLHENQVAEGNRPLCATDTTIHSKFPNAGYKIYRPGSFRTCCATANFSREAVTLSTAVWRVALVFALLRDAFRLGGRRVSRWRGIVAGFLARRAGAVGPRGCAVGRRGRRSRGLAARVLQRSYIILLPAGLLEFRLAVCVDLLLGKVVGAGAGCSERNGQQATTSIDNCQAHLPTHKEPQPSLFLSAPIFRPCRAGDEPKGLDLW